MGRVGWWWFGCCAPGRGVCPVVGRMQGLRWVSSAECAVRKRQLRWFCRRRAVSSAFCVVMCVVVCFVVGSEGVRGADSGVRGFGVG